MATFGGVSGDSLRIPNLRLMFFYVWHREQFVPGVPALAGFELRQEDCDLENIRFQQQMLECVGLRCAGLRREGLRRAGFKCAGLRCAGLKVAGLGCAGFRCAGLKVAALRCAGLKRAGLRWIKMCGIETCPLP